MLPMFGRHHNNANSLSTLFTNVAGSTILQFLKEIDLSKDGLVVNLYIPHNRRTPLQAEEALGTISIPRGSRGVAGIVSLNNSRI
jgi:hypothetical protein